MKCVRCEGLMVKERIYTKAGTLDVLTCVNCGNVEDEQILFNRIVMSMWNKSSVPA